MKISVVIPTCNRRQRLLSLLDDLSRSIHPLLEVIVVDSSDEALGAADFGPFPELRVRYLTSRRSVCVQRNLGIQQAKGDWIFLCDDDLEVPPDYVAKLADHAAHHETAGAISGLVLEREHGHWISQRDVTSARSLVWRYMFHLGVWGEIHLHGPFVDRVANYYRRRGNHITRAGWPVITDFSAPFFRAPIYGLGASLVRRTWLLDSPYDERLDPHGFGDNYGVALGFPSEGIHIVTGAVVHHHKEGSNRLPDATAYTRRTLALHYFIRTRPELAARSSAAALVWSLAGQAAFHLLKGNRQMTCAVVATLATIARGNNPYLETDAPHPGDNCHLHLSSGERK